MGDHVFDVLDKNSDVPIDARVIAYNETSYYNIEDEHKPFIKAIRNVYLYDKNEITHLCEITPSYWLIWLYTQVIFTDAGNELGDFEKNDIFEKYEQCGGNDNIYVHCHEVDQVEATAKKNEFRYYVYGATGVNLEDTSREEQMESLREHFQGNCPL